MDANCLKFIVKHRHVIYRCDVPAGSAVVDWLVFMQLTLTRVEAVTLASALLEEGCLRTVGLRSVEALRTAGLGEQFMDDSTALYSFVSTRKSWCTDLQRLTDNIAHRFFILNPLIEPAVQ